MLKTSTECSHRSQPVSQWALASPQSKLFEICVKYIYPSNWQGFQSKPLRASKQKCIGSIKTDGQDSVVIIIIKNRRTPLTYKIKTKYSQTENKKKKDIDIQQNHPFV